jgi:hypothetical protein
VGRLEAICAPERYVPVATLAVLRTEGIVARETVVHGSGTAAEEPAGRPTAANNGCPTRLRKNIRP